MVKRIVLHAVILLYLLITCAALLYTFFRARVPVLPWSLVGFSYGMMAPYQSVADYHGELVAEGFIGNTWERINLDAYYPFLTRGETNIRGWLWQYRDANESVLFAKYSEVAEKLMQREQEKGNIYESVRLSWVQWPISPEGFRALQKPPFATWQFLSEFPLSPL